MSLESAETGCPHCETWADHDVIGRPSAEADHANSMPDVAFECAWCGETFGSDMDLTKDECEREMVNQ